MSTCLRDHTYCQFAAQFPVGIRPRAGCISGVFEPPAGGFCVGFTGLQWPFPTPRLGRRRLHIHTARQRHLATCRRPKEKRLWRSGMGFCKLIRALDGRPSGLDMQAFSMAGREKGQHT